MAMLAFVLTSSSKSYKWENYKSDSNEMHILSKQYDGSLNQKLPKSSSQS